MKKIVIDQIISTIDHLTKTIEYQGIELFTESGYHTSRYYYTDHDELEKVEKVRELDFFALTNIESQIDGTHLKLMIKFIGDVKNHPYHNKRMFLLGLKPRKIGSLNSLYFWEGGLRVEHEKLVFPNCLDLYFFDEKGHIIKKENEERNKKKRNIYYKFRTYCEQIVSGFIPEVEKSGKKPHGLRDSKSSVMIPLLVFGNKVNFIVGSPEEIRNKKYSEPQSIFYHFQSTQPSADFLIPILITSVKNLQKTIKTIENELMKQFSQYNLELDKMLGIQQKEMKVQ